jgi:ParB family chromosome partitioning protein
VPRARGLGRGLSALIPEAEPGPGDRVLTLPLGAIRPNPFQPRRRFDAEGLEELAASVREHGVLQPIVVRPAAGGYEIVAGERRWRAAGMAGRSEIPAVVREVAEERMLEIALVENLQREDLGVWEEASALRALMRAHGWTQDEVAERVGKSRSHVANILRVLALPEGARRLVEDGRLTLAHVKAVLEAGPEHVEALAAEAAAKGWSVREVEARARALRASGGSRPARRRPGGGWPADLEAAAAALGERLGRPVRWHAAPKGGEIRLACDDDAEAARLLRALDRGLAFLEEHEGGRGEDVPRGTSAGGGTP